MTSAPNLVLSFSAAAAESRRSPSSLILLQVLLADSLMAREGRLALIAETKCCTLLAAEGATSVFEDIRNSRPDLRLLTLPSFDECLNTGGTAVHYPYERDYEEAQHDPILILHTSGTTGMHPLTHIGRTGAGD
jgi:hypothetical protein